MQIRKKLKKLIGFENIFAKEFKVKICKKKSKQNHPKISQNEQNKNLSSKNSKMKKILQV